MTPEQIARAAAIFFPHAWEREQHARLERSRLVHYTTAANAIKIIETGTLWLRNAQAMKDYSEIHHGFQELRECLHADNKSLLNLFAEALDAIAPAIASSTVERFDQWWANTQAETYISCFSEHLASEDTHGRLSMWRAFAPSAAGVAVVMKHPEQNTAPNLNVFLMPVNYFTTQELRGEMSAVVENIAREREFLKALPPNSLAGYLYSLLLLSTVTGKHPGFGEEREWRLVYFPDQYPSPVIVKATETIFGVPQIVCKLPLKNRPQDGIDGIEIPQLFERIIIGPSQYAASIWQSFVSALTNAGIPEAHTKVFISGIPLRD